ncbi:MAG TPA: 23S rRNA (adenine(2503)-C(2))-methyltransferase RlmN [Gammaproteobacteria bacterium]|nr:23S rRNA (adenine(2503)-C(2))-methyltransferase RlmN [Gammaproteobacteria bacterium]
MTLMTRNLTDFDVAGLNRYMEELGERPYRTTQLIKWIHQLGVVDVNEMTNISKLCRKRLVAETEIRFPEVVSQQKSADGTVKWLVQVDSGNCIETVFIPENDRGTLCVSSQIGCPLDCQFCATATQGFNRNLSIGEIIGQVWLAVRYLGRTPDRSRRLTNVVMMGMGEPLLNFDNVVGAMQLMMDDHAYNLARKRITLSTAGHVPGIDKLRQTSPVSLAVSLHAPNDYLRNELVPINRKYPIESLMDACRRYIDANPQDQITFEYVMLRGVNDDLALAKDLTRLLRGIPAKVNLIPFNQFDGSNYKCSHREDIDNFRNHLVRSGIVTITRKTRGDDIDAACGQLIGKVQAKNAIRRRLKELNRAL